MPGASGTNGVTTPTPAWQIHFTTPPNPGSGYLVLSHALASSRAGQTVTLNNQTALTYSGGSSHYSDAVERSGLSGYTEWIAYQWPISTLNTAGAENVITIKITGTNSDDAFRLELSPLRRKPIRHRLARLLFRDKGGQRELHHPRQRHHPQSVAKSQRNPMTAASAPPTNAADPLLIQLVALLRGGQAHVTFEAALANFPAHLRAVVPDNLPYSAWQILEHLRFTQRDILDFSAPPTGGYHAHQWPADYWPKSPEPTTPHSWDQTITAIRADQAKFESLLTKPKADLYRPFTWGTGQNLLREALLIADHNAYHLGELIVLRRLLGIWPA